MDPNSSPWAYAYNRIVPSTTTSTDEFQHPHLASISAAAGSSAQSLLLQAAHSSIAGFNATSGNFVSPNPIGGYNPVFQQIYHHAAQAAVQPKPAHYASSSVSSSHRQVGSVEKQDNCRSQPGVLGYPSNQAINLPNTSYYGENSSSSGASPSPTTSAASTTTLSWNTPVVGTTQQMSANIFLTMHQHQQQPHDITHVEKVNNSKQANLHTKAQTKSFGDIVYVESHENQHEQVVHQLDNQIINTSSDVDNTRPEDGFYTFVDGKLTYNIPAAAISSASITSKLPISSVKVVTPRKQCSVDSQQPLQQQNISQMPSPVYPIYESPSLHSSVGSPPPVVSSMHDTETVNNSGHIIVYKSNTPTQQAQTPIDVSTIVCSSSMVNRNNIFARSGDSSLSPTVSVAYSSVITSALQAHQQQQLSQRHQHSQQPPNCWLGNNVDKLSDAGKHNQKSYTIQASPTQENNLYMLPSSLQIKRTLLEPVNPDSDSTPATPRLQQQMINNGLHITSTDTVIDKQESHIQQLQPQQNSHRKEHAAENVLTANNSLASQIQSTKKADDIQKPNPPKKTPRKRQPKKTLLTNNDFPRTSQQNNVQPQSQTLRQQQHQTIPLHSAQQHQTVQLQQQNGSFYDYNNRWISQKIENNTDVSTFGNNQQQQAQSNVLPQPAHVQSSQTHSHIPQISQYYPAFPQQVSTQYAACMSQNNNLYNLAPLAQDAPDEQPHQQPSAIQAHSLHDQTTSIEAQPQPIAESSMYKVIVPNIEDELDFLSNIDANNTLQQQQQNNFGYNREVPHKTQPEAMPNVYPKNVLGKKTAFMDSYLKFLQGERDESPPPIIKSGRKFNYQKPITQVDSSINIKRKANEANQSLTTKPTAIELERSSLSAEPTVEHIEDKNSVSISAGEKNAHKIKIISQTQILPKKRPQAQNMAIGIPPNAQGIPEQASPHINQPLYNNVQSQLRQNQPQTQQQNIHQDPLAIPPRREQSLRKAKSRSIYEITQSSTCTTDRDEPEEFADSDADPVWTPLDDEHDDERVETVCGKRKHRRGKSSPSTKRKAVNYTNDLKGTHSQNDNNEKTTAPKMLPEVNSTTGNIMIVDNFKTGDFIVLRSDLVNDWPIIWQVDSKCILQKYEPFCQNGKMFYRNMSKYASWNLETKKLYLKAPVRIQIQSHTETIVEFMRSELLADDTEQFIEKVMEDYLTYRDHFEIYIQTMISQVLDPSFLSEINREKDEYFLSSVRTIDDIMENCKRKLLSITPWTRSVIVSIETWPQCHVFTEWGQNNVNQKNCGGCHQPGISVRFLLFGHPYNTSTMQTIPIDMRVAYEKDILLCRICAARADIFHKIAHEKYNLFVICTRRVGDHQNEYPGKGSTEILNDLLAENNWVDELFRNMRSSWAEVESLERQKRFHEASQ